MSPLTAKNTPVYGYTMKMLKYNTNIFIAVCCILDVYN